MARVEILIVSYAHDLPYLRHNLRSIKKFASGFTGVTLVVPLDEMQEFLPLVEPGVTVEGYRRTPDVPKWHLHAQVQKCLADKYCPNADFILHTDSDCIFTEPVTPYDYVKAIRPVMVIKPWSAIPGSPWKQVVDNVLDFDSQFSTMERHPQVNPRALYAFVRRDIERRKNMLFEEYVLTLKPTFPWGFTEHNIIGNFALKYFPNLYRWIDVSKELPPQEKLRQFWSYSPVDKEQDSPHGEPRSTPLAIINKILGE